MYFDSCHNLNELKAAYRALALKYHPDLGGDEATMKAINAEHDRVFARLKAAQNRQAEMPGSEVKPTTEHAEEFRRVVDLLLSLEGVTAELCGSWLWISGKTYQYKDELKGVGCRWSRSKRKWYWRHAEDWSRRGRGNTKMTDIRSRYGSQPVVDNEKRPIVKMR